MQTTRYSATHIREYFFPNCERDIEDADLRQLRSNGGCVAKV